MREGDWMAELSSPSSGGPEEAELRLPFVCQICGKAFKHAGSLSMHRRLHRGHTQCPVCHKVFSRTYYMKVHMQLIHHVNTDCWGNIMTRGWLLAKFIHPWIAGCFENVRCHYLSSLWINLLWIFLPDHLYFYLSWKKVEVDGICAFFKIVLLFWYFI